MLFRALSALRPPDEIEPDRHFFRIDAETGRLYSIREYVLSPTVLAILSLHAGALELVDRPGDAREQLRSLREAARRAAWALPARWKSGS